MPLNKETKHSQAIIVILLLVWLDLNKTILEVNHFGLYHYCSFTRMALVLNKKKTDKYQGESKVLQCFSNVWHNSAVPDVFIVKVTGHTGLCDAVLAWYSPSATHLCGLR